MNILLTTSTFPLALDDGRPRFIFDLANALAQHAARVTVLAPGAHGAPSRQTLGQVEVRRFSYFWPRQYQRLAYGAAMRETMGGSWLAKLQVPCYMMAQTRALLSLVRREQVQVLNSHWIVPQGLSGAIVKTLCPQVRHVVHIHAADVYLLRKLPLGLGRRLARWIVNRTDAIFADGSHVRQTLDELLGRPSQAKLCPMGADASLFRRIENAPPAVNFPDGYLLFFGRLVEKKGLTYLLKAMPAIQQRWRRLGLVVIGSGSLETALRAEAQRLGLEASVRFLGSQSQSVIAQYLHSCRAAVVPSIIDRRGETEGMPTVVLEAMAAGARVVASEVAGIPDVIGHGQNGWLARPADPGDLADKVLLALDDPSESPVIHAALATADDYAWPRVAERYMDVLRRLVSPAAALTSPAGAGA